MGIGLLFAFFTPIFFNNSQNLNLYIFFNKKLNQTCIFFLFVYYEETSFLLLFIIFPFFKIILKIKTI